MASECKKTRRVRFVETDAAGIVHFSNFFRFMEEVEDKFWKSIGLTVHGFGDNRDLGWPRVKASCDYISPLAFDDEFEMHLQVSQKSDKALTFTHLFTKKKGQESQVVARGEVVCVCVRFDQKTNAMQAVSIPPEIDQLIKVID